MTKAKLEALILGEDHYNTLNVIRALGQEGIDVYAVIISSNRKSFVLKTKYLSRGVCVDSINVSYLKDEFSRSDHRIPILATSDKMAAFIDSNYNALSEFFILPSVNNKEGELLKEMNKSLQLQHALLAGFDVPISTEISLNNLDTIESKIVDVRYPCLIKPEESIEGSKKDFRICYTPLELVNELRTLSDHISSTVLVQDFIKNDEVILVAGVRTHNGNNYVFGEVNKFKHGEKTNNLGLNCFGVLSPDSEIKQYCIDYVNSINYHGCYSVEVVRSRTASTDAHSINYFMEINLRTDGLLYFYTKAGINYPLIWVKSCYGEVEIVNCDVRHTYGMNEFLYLRNSLSMSTIIDFFRTDVFSTFSLKDFKPFLYRFLYHG